MPATTAVRVVVKLPYDRPEGPLNDPPKIEWTPEKADILWRVIERSRSADSPGADWKALAAHLEVPLPYLLYRVNARFQEEIHSLKDIQGALSPSTSQPPKTYDFPAGDKPSMVAVRMVGSSRLSASRLGTQLGVRARLNSLGNNSPRPRNATSSSTLTLQATRRNVVPLRPTSPASSDVSDSSDEEAIKEEEADRVAEEEEALSRKLAELQRIMTNESLGLVSNPRHQTKGKSVDRGRSAPMSPRSTGSSRMDALSSRSASAGSLQGSIPEIPSPSTGSQSLSSRSRNLSSKSSSPPALSPRNAQGHTQRRYGPLVDRAGDLGSNQGSETSSFSDLSLSEASFSASALDSAFNFGTGNSRFSTFKSRITPRNNTVLPQ